MKYFVSVIISTKNSSETLKKTLDGIKKQTYKNIEIIIVDNNSTDNTVKIAKKYTNKIYKKGPERCTQKNYGAKKAKGDILYFIDSDFILNNKIIEKAIEEIKKGSDAVVIHNTSDPTISFWSKIRKFERDMYKYDHNNIAVRFLKKSAFFKIGEFDTSLVSCEDYDLHNRFVKANYAYSFIDEEELHIGEPKNLFEIIKKSYYYGSTLVDWFKNKYNSVRQISPLRSSYVKHWKNFFKHPLLSIGFFIYLFVKYSSALLGFLFEKIRRIFK